MFACWECHVHNGWFEYKPKQEMLFTSEIHKPMKPLPLGLQAVEILDLPLLSLFWILALIKYSELWISELVLGTFPGAQTDHIIPCAIYLSR